MSGMRTDSTLDLGALDGPVLVFGGPYGNREATEALLAEAERRAIPSQRMICTGDVAAYCAEPQACVDLIRGRAIPCVMGNCEEQLGSDAEDCGCGFDAGSACATLSQTWFAYCRTALDREAKTWMGGLPRRIRFTLGGRRLIALHGGVDTINRFVFASTPERHKSAELDRADADGVIGGHCGLPFTQLIGGRLWHNAGAIGLPANDGTPRVWYSLLTPEADGISLSLHPLAYDHAGAARKMRAQHLPEGYASALTSGLWPSCDILPAAEISMRGQPLSRSNAVWRQRRPAAAAAPIAARAREVGQGGQAS